MTKNLEVIFGKKTTPFYIYSPPFIQESAGIRALHYLCHSLNTIGYQAWIVPNGGTPKGDFTNPWLLTPVLNEFIANRHFAEGLTPVVIYPETTIGNPLGAQIVARWLLNYAGALGGSRKFAEDEFCFAYSKVIADSYDEGLPVLFLPTLDYREIESRTIAQGDSTGDKKALVYAGKYRAFVGRPKLPTWAKGIETHEIWREGKRKQSRTEVLELLQGAPVLFAFENTALITEAIMLGTPVVLVRSKFFNELIAKHELSSFGCEWSDNENAIADAKKTLANAKRFYFEALERFPVELSSWAEQLSKIALASDYLAPVQLSSASLKSRQRVQIAVAILRTQGPVTLARETWKFLIRPFRQRHDG